MQMKARSCSVLILALALAGCASNSLPGDAQTDTASISDARDTAAVVDTSRTDVASDSFVPIVDGETVDVASDALPSNDTRDADAPDTRSRDDVFTPDAPNDALAPDRVEIDVPSDEPGIDTA